MYKETESLPKIRVLLETEKEANTAGVAEREKRLIRAKSAGKLARLSQEEEKERELFSASFQHDYSVAYLFSFSLAVSARIQPFFPPSFHEGNHRVL